MIDYLISNSYVKAFGKIFRQTQGIIMGGKSSGWLSDCSLMVDEFKFIDKKIKAGELELARKFNGLNRYRDDCTALNIENFKELATEIYPPCLELSQENEDLTQATVLDMSVRIDGGFFETRVYNKTDDFPFEVISLPFLDSNINENVCYLVFYSQILRYQRLCSHMGNFNERVKVLGDILLKRGYNYAKLKREFVKVINKYRHEFERWGLTSDVNDWFYNIFNTPTDQLTNTRTQTPSDNSMPLP